MPLALAGYSPNRRRVIVTFYHNEASMPGPVAAPPDWPPPDAFRPGDGVTLPKVVRETKPRQTNDCPTCAGGDALTRMRAAPQRWSSGRRRDSGTGSLGRSDMSKCVVVGLSWE